MKHRICSFREVASRGLLLLLSSGFILAEASAAEIELKSNIKNVTVYSLGAGVTHELDVDLQTGQNTLLIRGVSQYIQESSIQLNNEAVTVINTKLIKKLTPVEIQTLMDEKESCERQVQALNAILTSDKLEAQGISEIVEYYDTKIRSLKQRLRDIGEKLAEDQKNTGEAYLKVLVSSTTPIAGTLQLKYIVGSAAWVTCYEILVPDFTSKMKLRYIAKVMNKTGEDWSNVNLSLSLNSPFDKTDGIPRMSPMELNSRGYSSNDDSYKSAESIIEEENLKSLMIDGMEYESFEAPAYTDLMIIEDKVSVPANGGIYSFEVFTKEMNNTYIWYSFPSIERYPYLMARISDWNTLPIVDGVVKVYLKGASIGESYISVNGFPDTLEVPIGQNQEILVERTEVSNENTEDEGVNKVRLNYSFSYVVKSNSGLPLTVRVFDQVPVSQSKDLEVTVNEKGGGTMEDETGFVTWDFDLKERQEKKEFKLAYTIVYSKDKVSFNHGRSSSFYQSRYKYMYGKSRKVRAKF